MYTTSPINRFAALLYTLFNIFLVDSQHYSGDSDVIDEEIGSKKSDIISVSEAIEAKLDEAQPENIIETDIGAAGEQIEVSYNPN